jgi:Inner membrane protein YgaP-like, transmembrane domain
MEVTKVSRVFQRNEGPEDRVIRVALGIVFLALAISVLTGYGVLGLVAFSGMTGTVVAWALAVFGVIGVVTGATGRCPTYVLLFGGFSTLHEAKSGGAATGTPVGSH